MPRFTTVTTNDATPGETFAFVIDLGRWPLFTGHGPLPGIVEASLPAGSPMGRGARIRVVNSDGSVHHEVVEAYEPGRRYAIRMELSPPASRLLWTIEEEVDFEEVDGGGTRVVRTFRTVPCGWWTAPAVWLLTRFLLRPAVVAHDRKVAQALSRVAR